MQVAKAATMYGRHVQGLRVATVVGGVPYPAQIKALMGPLDILISTPGRLLDHLQSGRAVLDNVQMLVLDEADRMLDMGFIDDIQTIARPYSGHAPNRDVQRHVCGQCRQPGPQFVARPETY
jgi:superfamily II DNA/RNA helicase